MGRGTAPFAQVHSQLVVRAPQHAWSDGRSGECLLLHFLCRLPFSFDAASALCQYPERLEILPAEGNRISFRISILASGSTGNCDVARNRAHDSPDRRRPRQERNAAALRSAGPARAPSAWTRILITHEHSDHSSGRGADGARMGLPRVSHRADAPRNPEDVRRRPRKTRAQSENGARRIHSRGRAFRDRRHRNQSVRDSARRRRSRRLSPSARTARKSRSSPTSAICPSW